MPDILLGTGDTTENKIDIVPGLTEACHLADRISHCHLLLCRTLLGFFIYVIPQTLHKPPYKVGVSIIVLQFGKLKFHLNFFPGEG